MAGYSQTPLWKKLGYRDGARVYVDGPPSNYTSLLALPTEVSVTWLRAPKKEVPFVHLFVTVRSRLKSKLRLYREKMAADGVVWVSWPKRSSGVPTEINEDLIREIALPLGFVDIKVCAVDGVWSGLKLMIRKELR